MKNNIQATSEQKKILNLMRSYKALSGEFPSLTHIYKSMGYKNKSSAQYHVNILRRNGLLDLIDYSSDVTKIPLAGSISCGPAILAEENIEGYIPIETSRLKQKSANYFFLRATGDSMDKADINPGDYVLIRQQPTAKVNEIVAALIGDDATLKRLDRAKDGVPLLKPCSTNPVHKVQYMIENFSILGVMEDVITPTKGVIV